MVEDSVAAEKYFGEHTLDHWVSTGALLEKGVQDLASTLLLLLDFEHEVEQGGEHLKVDAELLL